MAAWEYEQAVRLTKEQAARAGTVEGARRYDGYYTGFPRDNQGHIAMSAPISGTNRFQITAETLRGILQEWWNTNTNFPPTQIVAVMSDHYNSGYMPVNHITIELLPIDPILQKQEAMMPYLAGHPAQGTSTGAVGATGYVCPPAIPVRASGSFGNAPGHP